MHMAPSVGIITEMIEEDCLTLPNILYGMAVRPQYNVLGDPSAILPTLQESRVVNGRCEDFLADVPDRSVQLVVTSPPYNVGKSYERRRGISEYTAMLEGVIEQCARKVTLDGSLCWQVGNYVAAASVIPIDILIYPIFAKLGFTLRNRIIWHFEHGLHATRRFSGRYETIMWFTRSNYYFDVDPIRVPQKYPNKKHYKGPNIGKLSGNPLGKNPGDLWIIPNVKHNHVEKTDHPCQFPVELVERLVLSMSRPGDIVLDPYLGVGSTAIAALKHHRRIYGAEISKRYFNIAMSRIDDLQVGRLKHRRMGTPVYVAPASSSNLVPA